jgi:hypothetical protein
MWCVDAASLRDAGTGLPRLRSSPPSSPALGAALTPGPSPALRERGDVVYRRGIVERRRHRIATATLVAPLPLTV